VAGSVGREARSAERKAPGAMRENEGRNRYESDRNRYDFQFAEGQCPKPSAGLYLFFTFSLPQSCFRVVKVVQEWSIVDG